MNGDFMTETTVEDDLAQSPLSDREIVLCETTIVELCGILERFPAPVGVQGGTLTERELEMLQNGFEEAKQAVFTLVGPLLIERIQQARKIGK